MQYVDVQACIGAGVRGVPRSHSKGTHCLCKAGHLLSWFCFSSSQWAPDPSCKQREFKNCNPSCVPKCSECCGELERWQLGCPALPLQQEATAHWLPPPVYIICPRGGEQGAAAKLCTPNQGLIMHLPWAWGAYVRHRYAL